MYTKKSILFYLIVFGLISCNKFCDNKPCISARSAEKRIVGKWKIVRLYYYDGALGGLTHDGDTTILYRELEKDGVFNLIDSNGILSKKQGYWSWLSGNQKYESKEAIAIGYSGLPITELHILLNLHYKKIKSQYFFDNSDPKRYYIYEWSRIKS